MKTLDVCFQRATKCLTGQWLNPLMHVFMLITLSFSIAFLFFGYTNTVQASVLFTQTQGVGTAALNVWAVVGLIAVLSNYVGLIIRGKYGLPLMQVSMFSGFYMWLWASIVYIQGAFFFQLFTAGVPLLLFWIWYAWQWRRRHRHPNDDTYSAFV